MFCKPFLSQCPLKRVWTKETDPFRLLAYPFRLLGWIPVPSPALRLHARPYARSRWWRRSHQSSSERERRSSPCPGHGEKTRDGQWSATGNVRRSKRVLQLICMSCMFHERATPWHRMGCGSSKDRYAKKTNTQLNTRQHTAWIKQSKPQKMLRYVSIDGNKAFHLPPTRVFILTASYSHLRTATTKRNTLKYSDSLDEKHLA